MIRGIGLASRQEQFVILYLRMYPELFFIFKQAMLPVSADDLPTRQKDVLRLIVELTEENGYPPTLAELAKALGLKNRMTVHQHVVALKKKGLVQWEPGLNRSLRILQNLQTSVDDSRKKAKSKFSLVGSNGIPLVGVIAAGRPIDVTATQDQLEIDKQYAESGCYALKVKGESMLEEGIYDGDYVIVKPEPSPRNGELVVALLSDGSATLKRFHKEKGQFRLQPANREYEPIYIPGSEELQIQGVVVALYRKL
jgi:repressor LexA